MKLYLSSYRVPTPDTFLGLLPARPRDIRMALVPNAKDYYAELAWNYKVVDYVKYFHRLGFRPEVLDLRQHDRTSLKTLLPECQLVWVCGGNTFNLRYELQRSGFDHLIKDAVQDGLVYGGDSAGAIVAGPTLRGAELADDPHFTPKVIYSGMHLVPNVIIPHADSMEYGYAIARMTEMHMNKPNTVVLNDNQALVVDGQEKYVVTA